MGSVEPWLMARWKARVEFLLSVIELLFTAHRNARIASTILATANFVRLSVRLSVCLSVTRRYCVKTTARSTVQFALSDSKMCLVLQKPKNIAQGRPLPPEILTRSDLPLLQQPVLAHFAL